MRVVTEVITCDFCKKHTETAQQCMIGEKFYDICDLCIPEGCGRPLEFTPIYPGVLGPLEQKEEVPPPPPPVHVPAPNVLQWNNLPETCYAARYLKALAKGKRILAQHNKAKAMHVVAKYLRRTADGDLQILGLNGCLPPQLLDIIRYVNANPHVLEFTHERFGGECEKKGLGASSSAKAYRGLFIANSKEEV